MKVLSVQVAEGALYVQHKARQMAELANGNIEFTLEVIRVVGCLFVLLD